MKGKLLSEIQLIDTLLKYNKLKISGNTRDSFYEKFSIISNGKGGYDDSQSPINARTLRRQIKDLCDEGIFKKIDEDYYIIDKSNFMFHKLLNDSKWMEILDILLQNNETDTYKYIRNYIGEVVNKPLLDDGELSSINKNK